MAEGLNANQTISSLEEIFLSDAPPSLQRVLLTIQAYDFEIKYIPGKEVALADAVSRLNPQDDMELKGLDFTTCAEQKYDATMQLLIQEFASRVALVLQVMDQPSRYWTLRHDLSIKDDCIAYLGKLFHLTYGNSVWDHCIGVF